MYLVIVESPSKAKTINKYLGKDYIVVSSYGHVRGIPSRRGAVECDNNFLVHYEVQEKSGRHISAIMSYAPKADRVYLATDPDREGEAISWHIAQIIKEKLGDFDDKIARITFQEVTKNAIIKAIENPRKIDDDLVQAQQARQALDYLVGFSVSPILWVKLPGTASAGRVQSPALGLICEREEEIRRFKVEEYWSVSALFFDQHFVGINADNAGVNVVLGNNKNKQDDGGNGTAEEKKKLLSPHISSLLVDFKGKKIDKMTIKEKGEAEEIIDLVKPCRFIVDEVDHKSSKKNPPPPFTTSTMIQYAANRLGFSSKKTAKIAQELYEGIEIDGERTGLITYMRTDSVHISQEAVNATLKQITKQFGGDFAEAKPRVFSNKKNAQEAHEAIRPTRVEVIPEDIKSYLTPDQYNLYNAIWRRLVASQMKPAVLNNTAVTIRAEENDKKNTLAKFRATGTVVAFPGYYAVMREVDTANDEQMLPIMHQGDELPLMDVVGKKHQTKPPARYNEASLVKKMEEIGIGRPSTYASIISILQERKYALLDKQKRFVPDIKGEGLHALLANFFEEYFSYGFTANLESGLDMIASGENNYLDFLHQFWSKFSQIVDKVMGIPRDAIANVIEERLTNILFSDGQKTCPQCKTHNLHLRTTKFGWFIGCSGYPDCDYSRSIGRSSDHDVESKDSGGNVNVAAVSSAGEGKIYPKHLIDDPKSNQPIYLQKGPYGIYIRVGEAKDKRGKNVSIPKEINPDDIDGELALVLASLPKKIGKIEDLDIAVGYGKFGPYVLYDKKYYRILPNLLRAEQKFWEITLEQAQQAIAAKKSEGAAGGVGGRRTRKNLVLEEK